MVVEEADRGSKRAIGRLVYYRQEEFETSKISWTEYNRVYHPTSVEHQVWKGSERRKSKKSACFLDEADPTLSIVATQR